MCVYHRSPPRAVVQTGKSYMLNEVLPVVASAYNSSSSSSSSSSFLRVSCLGCDRINGSGGFLKGILIRLKHSAARQELSAAASTPVPSDTSADTMAMAIKDFMERLPRDRLNFVLVDEAQCFFLLRRPASITGLPRGPLDVDAQLQMRW
jgi:hypothetical protein